ncbi:hypothetical protein PV327_005863 [Microctonus hyperodae]|uniref:Uncharacterized protein n=1 Tax=Microctonus hyperodae TaxID=165561 RepID=A0AA39G290_MICHY|nr:hypothetical protein PV327_005863 [Microctonus hyperodae]
MRHIRAINFPQGSGTGIFFAIGVPLDIPDKSVSLSFYFEANYRLPDDNNVTNVEEYFHEKGMTRKLVYDVIQNKLEGAGYPGRSCLLRAICEAASSSFNENGLIGDILRVLFVPSSSRNEDLPEDITIAEYEKNCTNYNNKCPMSLLDLISHYT